jgi:hypothetical protein
VFRKVSNHRADSRLDPNLTTARFNDSHAERTSWEPLKGGGTNFKTHVLEETHPGRLEFRISPGMIAFSAVFAFIGLALLGYKLATASWPYHKNDWSVLVIGAVFALAGLGMLYSGSTRAVFDRNRGYFIKSRKRPEQVAAPSTLKNHVALHRIHAVQLLSEYCKGDKSRYFSYELNLVLDDGSRLNVIDHGDLQTARADAQTLAAFLGKPLWDAV